MTHPCEADVLALEGWNDPDVPPCDAEGVVTVADRWLCRGCADALAAIRKFANVVISKEDGPRE